MKHYRHPAALALILLIATSPLAFAQQDDSDDDQRDLPPFIDDSRRFELTASFILQGSGLNYVFIEGGRDAVTNSDNSRFSGELRLSYYFSRYKSLGVEGYIGYTHAGGTFQYPTDYTDEDNPIVYPIENVDHSVLHYGAGAIYNFGYLDVVPFITFGFGVNDPSPTDDSSFPLTDIYYNLELTLGFKYFLKEWFGVRAELIDSYYMYPEDIASGNENTFRFKVGAVLAF